MDIATMPTPENHNGGDGGYHGPFTPPSPYLVQDSSFTYPFKLSPKGEIGFAPVIGVLTPVTTDLAHPVDEPPHLYSGWGGGAFPGGFSAMQTDGPITPGTYWQVTAGYGPGFSVSRNDATGEWSMSVGVTTKGVWGGVVTVE